MGATFMGLWLLTTFVAVKLRVMMCYSSHPFRQWVKHIEEEHPEMVGVAKDFFVVFSRFEHALKQNGFWRRNGGYQGPDWDRFACENEEVFRKLCERNQEIENAIRYLVENPPRRETPGGWSNSGISESSDSSLWPLLRVVRIIKSVRNNLFHGGKEIDRDRERDIRLMCYSLTVLGGLMEIDQRIRQVFNTRGSS